MKYNSCVFKFHVAIGFHGLIHAFTGPAIGVNHDDKMWDRDSEQFPMVAGELLGDWHFFTRHLAILI